MSALKTTAYLRGVLKEFSAADVGIDQFDVKQVLAKTGLMLDLGGYREFAALLHLDVTGVAPTAGAGKLKIELFGDSGQTSFGTFDLGAFEPNQTADRKGLIFFGGLRAPAAIGGVNVTSTTDVRVVSHARLIWDQTTANDAGTSAVVSVRLFALA